MEAYDWNPVTTLALTVRNVGPATITFSDFFINGVLQAAPTYSGGCAGATPSLAVGSSCTLTVAGLTGYSSGVEYSIKIVTIDGAVFSYSAIAGSST
jgi:hypothetical protein